MEEIVLQATERLITITATHAVEEDKVTSEARSGLNDFTSCAAGHCHIPIVD